MRVTIFGSGYVGLVQAAALAEVGNDVVCVDIDVARVRDLSGGVVRIYEPGLERSIQEGLAAKRLRFTSDAAEGVAHGSIVFIAVGTPQAGDGSADLRQVLGVAEAIGRSIDRDCVIVVKSTVPVGTGDQVRATIEAELGRRQVDGIDVDVASNPEFLKEGSAMADFMRPDRIVIGVADGRAEQALRELYAPFNRNREKIMVMDVRSAELTKYAANCMLATKISFMNEMAGLAERLGADIEQVRRGIGADPRIGPHFIYAGIGYGGACFPKDIKALIHAASATDCDAGILRAVEKRNERQKHALLDKIMAHFDGAVAGRTFALWGLSFKPNTDDMREAPSRVIMEGLWRAGAKVRAYDPKAMAQCRTIYGERDGLTLCERQEQALEGADALIVATEWRSFQSPDFAAVARALAVPVVFDGRNIYDPDRLRRYGLDWHGIGRAPGPRLRPVENGRAV